MLTTTKNPEHPNKNQLLLLKIQPDLSQLFHILYLFYLITLRVITLPL